jgi:hypothetical protein
VVAEYQFELITCTKDELRRHRVSGKHLDYLAHGLPLLASAWRRQAVEA